MKKLTKQLKTSKTKLNKKPSKISFIHLRYASDEFGYDSHGGATIAYRFVPKEEKTILEIALTVCSYYDNFNKFLGRTVSTHRLNAKAPQWYFCIELSNKEAVKTKYEKILNHATKHWIKELEIWNEEKEADLPF